MPVCSVHASRKAWICSGSCSQATKFMTSTAEGSRDPVGALVAGALPPGAVVDPASVVATLPASPQAARKPAISPKRPAVFRKSRLEYEPGLRGVTDFSGDMSFLLGSHQFLLLN